MEKSNKRKAELEENVEGRVLLVENPDGVLHNLIKVLEDHSYEVFKCNGVDGLLSQLMKENRIDIILTEGNQLDPMYVSQHLTQILLQTNLPVISISSNDNNINSHYHWLKGKIVRPILELVENLFYDRISKSGEVKRLNEEIKQVELPDEEKWLKEEVEHDELPDEEKLPEEKRLEGEVEHAEMPDEENKKKLVREKAGEHHQRMVWIGDVETMFVNIVTELDDNKGKVTGKIVWECMQANGFKDISLKQVNSHLQKYRRKHKKVHPVDNSYQMLECKDQVDTSAGQDASRHGMEEHSSKTDAPMKTINGNLNTTSQEQHLNTEFLNNNIPGNFENGKGKDIIEDKSYTYDDFRRTDLAQALLSSPVPIEATLLSTMEEGQPSNLHVNDIHGQAFDKNVSDLQSEEYKKLYIPAGNFENGRGKDIIEDQSYTYDDFRRTDLAQALLSSPVSIEATLLSTMEEGQPSNLHVNDIHGQAFDKNVSDLQSEEYNNLYIPAGNFDNGKGKVIIEDQSYRYDDFRRTEIAQALLSSPVPIEATLLFTMEEGQPSNLHVNDIHGQAFDKNVSDLQSEEYKKLYIPAGITSEDFNLEDTDPQQHLNMDIDFSEPLDPDGMNPNTFENFNFRRY